jgi:hypothetical protein
MNNQLTTINTKKLDITKPAQFAEFVAQAKALANVLEEAWGVVEQQMLDRSVSQLKGDWGTISFQEAELLQVVDATVLDPGVTKPALDTKKVRAYRDLMGELHAGVGTKNITKFVKRIKG